MTRRKRGIPTHTLRAEQDRRVQQIGPRSLQEIAADELYEDAVCVCGAEAVVTDVNGIDLCRECADGCRIPRADA